MKYIIPFLVLILSHYTSNAQNDIVLDLDSIKNIKTTRYSSINEVGVAINIGGKLIDKFLNNTKKLKIPVEKPGVMIRTVHGILINPKLFVGAGIGIDFRRNTTGVSSYFITFPIFGEFREYVLEGKFNIYFSERLGGAVIIDRQLNKVNNNGNKGTSYGAFGEFMIGGRYITPGKKISVHFGLGYRLQHSERKINISDPSIPTQVIRNVREISIKHYIPATVGVTF